MNTKQEKQIVIGAAVLGAAIIGYSVYKTVKRKREFETQQKLEAQQAEAQRLENQPAKEVLNVSKTLKIGSRGNEVRTLQKWLGIKVDGVFGNKTLYALQKQFGVNELDLDEYKRAVSVPRVDQKIAKIPSKATPTIAATKTATIVKKKETPALGSKIMAVKPRVSTFKAEKQANGVYFNKGKRVATFAYGKEVGTFLTLTGSKQWVLKSGNNVVVVRPDDVKAI